MNIEWIRESCALNAHWWIDSVYLLMDSVFNLTRFFDNDTLALTGWTDTLYLTGGQHFKCSMEELTRYIDNDTIALTGGQILCI
jgi:hypothetical protein